MVQWLKTSCWAQNNVFHLSIKSLDSESAIYTGDRAYLTCLSFTDLNKAVGKFPLAISPEYPLSSSLHPNKSSAHNIQFNDFKKT